MVKKLYISNEIKAENKIVSPVGNIHSEFSVVVVKSNTYKKANYHKRRKAGYNQVHGKLNFIYFYFFETSKAVKITFVHIKIDTAVVRCLYIVCFVFLKHLYQTRNISFQFQYNKTGRFSVTVYLFIEI